MESLRSVSGTEYFFSERNNCLLEEVLRTSKVYWLCERKHEFKATVSDVERGARTCAECRSRKANTSNNVAALHPELLEVFDESKNKKELREFLPTYTRTVWWKAICGHSFKASFNKMISQPHYCRCCFSHQVSEFKNDLMTTHPEFVKEYWDFKENTLTPRGVTYLSSESALFKCTNCGNSKKMTIKNAVTRLSKTKACRSCNNWKLVKRENDVLTLHPWIQNFWDYEKNALAPSQVKASSAEKVHLKCSKCENSFSSSLRNFVRPRSTKLCSSCYSLSKSLGEKEVFDFLVSKGFKPEAKVRGLIESFELDLLIRELGLAIEYNGEYWHSDKIVRAGRRYSSAKEYHKLKRNLCHSQGITLAFVWEDDWLYDKENTVKELENFLETNALGKRLTRVVSNRD